MTKFILLTDSSDLIGTAICERYAKTGWTIYGVDNYLRRHLYSLGIFN